MKRCSLISVMLIVVLALGLAFVSCGDGNNYDRSIEELFNKVKNVGVYLSAYTSDDMEYDYCTQHQRWEMVDSHTATPNFRLADAVMLVGWYFFYLYRNGNGRFGGTTQTVQSPLWTDHYYFY